MDTCFAGHTLLSQGLIHGIELIFYIICWIMVISCMYCSVCVFHCFVTLVETWFLLCNLSIKHVPCTILSKNSLTKYECSDETGRRKYNKLTRFCHGIKCLKKYNKLMRFVVCCPLVFYLKNNYFSLCLGYADNRLFWIRLSWRELHQKKENKHGNNTPFYSCVLSYLAFEWKWGWSWPCFDRNLTAFGT